MSPGERIGPARRFFTQTPLLGVEHPSDARPKLEDFMKLVMRAGL
jgi:hypothetical protein